jgi:hypothetical protein
MVSRSVLAAFATRCCRGTFRVLREVVRIGLGSANAVTAPTALAAGFRSTFAILREVARIMLGTTAAATILSAFAPGFRGALAVIGEIARTVLPADLTGARCLFAILSEVSRIPCMSLISHRKCSLLMLRRGLPVADSTGGMELG